MSKLNLTKRLGEPPEVSKEPPQMQYTDQAPKHIYDALHAWLFDPTTFPNAEKRPSLVADSTVESLFLKPEIPVAHDDWPFKQKGAESHEFAHLHSEGSCHVIVSAEMIEEVIASNRGIRHMFYYSHGIKETFLYAPRNEEEIEVVKKIVQEAYKYAIGA